MHIGLTAGRPLTFPYPCAIMAEKWRREMLGQYLRVTRIVEVGLMSASEWIAAGRVDAETIHPDGTVLVRINDKWFQLSECEG